MSKLVIESSPSGKNSYVFQEPHPLPGMGMITLHNPQRNKLTAAMIDQISKYGIMSKSLGDYKKSSNSQRVLDYLDEQKLEFLGFGKWIMDESGNKTYIYARCKDCDQHFCTRDTHLIYDHSSCPKHGCKPKKYLYVAEIYDPETNEKAVKVGITFKKGIVRAQQGLHGTRLKLFHTDVIEYVSESICVKIEKMIKNRLRNRIYCPSEQFRSTTETFNMDSKREIYDVINQCKENEVIS